MKKIIKLQTHDGSNNYLEQYKGHVYKLVTQHGFLRGGEIDENHKFIDPSGGPMIVENCVLEGTDWIVDNIEFKKGVGQLITLRHDIPSNQPTKIV